MELINNLPPQGNVLFISNGCGGGHIQTISSLEAQLAATHTELRSTTIDVYKNSFGNCIGNCVIDRWSREQKEGDVKALNSYLKYGWVERYVLSIFTFFGFVVALLKNNTDVVVNVQPFGLGALLSAIRVVNCVRRFFCCQTREPIRISMILTELPNAETKNFFPGIKGLSSGDLKYFTLYTTHPLLEPGQTEEDFWKTHCGLPMENVKYDRLPVRQAFFDQIDKPRPTSLTVKVDSDENRQLIVECCGEANLSHQQDSFTFELEPEDRLLSIHLGGQACISAANGYLLSRIQDQTPRIGKEYIFILCGDNNSENSLFAQVIDNVKKNPLPDGLHIVPLTRQTDVEIAPLLARSDAAIIKSGGLTSMEVFTVPPEHIFIHSMCPKEIVDNEEMIEQGMPVWEGGNARYLMETKQARVVTTETIGNNIYS
jgi:hypothetical protein